MKIFLLSAFFLTGLNGFAQQPVYTISDTAFLQLADTNNAVQKITGGFGFLEGPLWDKEGYLLFSDLRVNKIFRLNADGKTEVFLDKSGYHGNATEGISKDFGSDALAYDKDGNILICQHGDHAISVLSKNKKMKLLVDSYLHKRLNSPDDLTVKSDGSIYFTDPPYVFPKLDEDSGKQQKENGIYRYKKGVLKLLSTDYHFPNGICFSPDEKYLYVCSYGNDEPVRRYEVPADGTLKNGIIFYKQNGDGLKTDSRGNIFLCNYLGVQVISPEGKLLGTISCPEAVTNINWGDEDRKTLYIVAQTSVYKVRLKVAGFKPIE